MQEDTKRHEMTSISGQVQGVSISTNAGVGGASCLIGGGAGSAGTSTSGESQSGGGTTFSTTPEPKCSTNMPGGSRSDIHYPPINGHPSKIYESKKNKKIVRLMTVLAYMFAVSLAAMVLSLYYLLLWDPYMPIDNATFAGQSLSKGSIKMQGNPPASERTSTDAETMSGNTTPLPSGRPTTKVMISAEEERERMEKGMIPGLSPVEEPTNIIYSVNGTVLEVNQSQSGSPVATVLLSPDSFKAVKEPTILLANSNKNDDARYELITAENNGRRGPKDSEITTSMDSSSATSITLTHENITVNQDDHMSLADNGSLSTIPTSSP